jgi:hypothetical protein
MHRLTLISIACLAVLSLTAGSAQAGWLIGGKPLLSGSAAIATTASLDNPSTLSVPSLGLQLLCAGPSLWLQNGLQPPDLLIIQQLLLHNCLLQFPEGCRLVTVGHTPWVALTFPVPGPVYHTVYRPKTKKILGEYQFEENGKCALEGSVPLEGSYTVKNPSFSTESETHVFEDLGSVENNSLELGAGNKAYFTGGSELVKLASGSKWSFQ